MPTTLTPAEARGFGAYLNYDEASRYLSVSPRYLYAAKARGDLPTIRMGRRVVFARTDLDTFAQSNRFWQGLNK